jgi:membrane-associated phospholipid phosphatase
VTHSGRPHVAVHLQRHLVLLAGAAAAFFFAFLIVDNNPDSVSDWEVDLTKWLNDAPAWLARGLWPIMQLGTVWAPMVIGIVAISVYGWRRGVAVIVSGIAAWFLAKYVKDIVARGRPLHFIPTIDVREGKGTGLGFVSGHTAVAFAIATALLPVLSRRGRIVAYSLASIVGLARIVYGVHFPLDVVGGAALGIACGCVVDLVMLAIPAPKAAPVAFRQE